MVALSAVAKYGRASRFDFARVYAEGSRVLVAEESGDLVMDVREARNGVGEVELEDVRLGEEGGGGVNPFGYDVVAGAFIVGEVLLHGEAPDEGGVVAVHVVEAGDDDVADVAVGVDELAGAAEEVEAAAVEALLGVVLGGGVCEVDVVGLDEAERGREDLGQDVHGEVGAGAAVGQDEDGRDAGARGRGQAQRHVHDGGEEGEEQEGGEEGGAPAAEKGLGLGHDERGRGEGELRHRGLRGGRMESGHRGAVQRRSRGGREEGKGGVFL